MDSISYDALIDPDNKVKKAFYDVGEELGLAVVDHSSMVSAHEGYAIILEELEELWEEVKRKPGDRCLNKMYNEAKQVAAMAIRFMVDIC